MKTKQETVKKKVIIEPTKMRVPTEDVCRVCGAKGLVTVKVNGQYALVCNNERAHKPYRIHRFLNKKEVQKMMESNMPLTDSNEVSK